MLAMKRITIVHILLPAALLVTLLLMATLLLTPQQHAAAQGLTPIRIEPPDSEIDVGDTVATAVQVVDVENFCGVEFRLTFDPDIVQPEDSDLSTPGSQIAVGPVFTDQDPNYFVGRNHVYTETGVIEFRAALRSPAPSFNMTGTVASITWMGIVSGTSDLTLEDVKLSDCNGDPIAPDPQNGQVKVEGDGNGDNGDDGETVSGTVELQGRGDYSGTYVFVTTEVSACVTVETIPIPGLPYAVTDAQGCFEITLYDPPSPYDPPYRCLQAMQHGYLIGQYCLPTGESWGDLGTITLPGGDATEDDKINIFDLALIAARYGGDDVTADINGDDNVDIYDLVITAGNMGNSGPVTDWE
jgi:hypothetical protein